MSIPVNPLATVKGQKFDCELCGKAACLACTHCRVTYYCGKEHQSVDWFGIHEKICQLLGALRTLRPTLGSEDERQRRLLTVNMSQHALIDLCKSEAQKNLASSQFELAIPGALQSLRFSMDVYGAGHIELVPAYLLLAEANLGLERYKIAEEFLIYANWIILKNADSSNQLKAQLYRNFGRLYAAQQRYDDALRQLAYGVYYSSLDSGPEHIYTSHGYYQMARVFMLRQDVEHMLAFYDKVVDIWYKFLIKLKQRNQENIFDYLSEAQISEAAEMLRNIYETRQTHLGAQHIASGEACQVLAVLRHLSGAEDIAKQLYIDALAVYIHQFGDQHDATKAIQKAIDELNSTTTTTTISSGVVDINNMGAANKKDRKKPIPSQSSSSNNSTSTTAVVIEQPQ